MCVLLILQREEGVVAEAQPQPCNFGPRHPHTSTYRHKPKLPLFHFPHYQSYDTPMIAMAFNLQAPEIHLSHPRTDFIDNRLDADFHPAFADDSKVNYNMDLDKYVPQPENSAIANRMPREIKNTKEIDEQEQRLKVAITEYVGSLKSKDKTKLEIDYVNSCRTWDDVIAAMETARARYDGKEVKGFCPVRTIRNGFRKFASVKPSIESWLRLLPRDSLYGSLLCGGLEVIFGVSYHPSLISKLVLKPEGCVDDGKDTRRHIRSTRGYTHYHRQSSESVTPISLPAASISRLSIVRCHT